MTQPETDLDKLRIENTRMRAAFASIREVTRTFQVASVFGECIKRHIIDRCNEWLKDDPRAGA